MPKNLKQKNIESIDIIKLYAYSDKSHARDRQLWRGFLCSVIPILLPQYAELIDNYIIDSLVEDVEELVTADMTTCQSYAMRVISTHIAKSIGVSTEFAIAAFYDSDYDINLPTKLYKFHYFPVKKKIKENQEENMINLWLARFYQACNQKNFIHYMELWKDWLG